MEYYSLAIISILLGAVAISRLIVSKIPSAQPYMENLKQYQGYLGLVGIFSGLFYSIFWLFHIGLLSGVPLLWISAMVTSLTLLAVGLLTGVTFLKTFIKDEKTKERLDSVVNRLTPYQTIVGFMAIGTGVFFIILCIIR